MIILALDALDLSLVKKFDCRNLMQKECGQTDISEFKLERTVVLWASFLTGKNMEAEIPVEGQWESKLKREETFLKFFDSKKAIDMPAYSLMEENHREERRLLKAFFNDDAGVEEYDRVVWKNHEENKKVLFQSLGRFDLVLSYFDLADAIGHLSFGILSKMKEVYEELESLAKRVKGEEDFTLIVSDHGMKAVGRYGDHTRNGFYSLSKDMGLNLPKITDFYRLIERVVR
ncbi:MAG: hypothetical protein ACE5L6_02455 [Candidatus Bathyarchaeia archaeon]